MSEKIDPMTRELIRIADMDFELFRSITLDVMDAYERGNVSMWFVGGTMKGQIFDTTGKIISRKYKIDSKTFNETLIGAVECMHQILTKETEDNFETLRKTKNEKTANKYLEKIRFIEDVMKKHPGVELGFWTYTLSKGKFFQKVAWEAQMKVFSSPTPHVEKPYPTLPVGKIKISLTTSEPPMETESFEFEITPKDLETLIRSLENLKEAMANLETKKLVDR